MEKITKLIQSGDYITKLSPDIVHEIEGLSDEDLRSIEVIFFDLVVNQRPLSNTAELIKEKVNEVYSNRTK